MSLPITPWAEHELLVFKYRVTDDSADTTLSLQSVTWALMQQQQVALMSKSGPKCWIYRFLQKPKENPKGHFEFLSFATGGKQIC